MVGGFAWESALGDYVLSLLRHAIEPGFAHVADKRNATWMTLIGERSSSAALLLC
jgi:hypothetical protein